MSDISAEPESALAAGCPVVVADRAGGGLVFAASRATTALMAFTVRHSSGFVCVALPAQRCDALALPPMHPRAARGGGATFCVAVDAVDGTSTGISASDRAATALRLADPRAVPADFTRPGHVVPVAVRPSDTGGLAEVAAALVGAAGEPPVAVFAHLVSPADPTRMADEVELDDFARHHGLPLVAPATRVLSGAVGRGGDGNAPR